MTEDDLCLRLVALVLHLLDREVFVYIILVG